MLSQAMSKLVRQYNHFWYSLWTWRNVRTIKELFLITCRLYVSAYLINQTTLSVSSSFLMKSCHHCKQPSDSNISQNLWFLLYGPALHKKNKLKKKPGADLINKKWIVNLRHANNQQSPGLVVKGRDSCSEGRGFESRHRILDGHFFLVYLL